ncbi:MAG TPA: response regulator [Ktedonobacterales bacterium]|nr:response regulator [Ktedonobacterales bacterium]
MSPGAFRPRILIVAADRARGDLLERILADDRYQTARASSLEDAFTAVHTHRYQLVLVDLFRPSFSHLIFAAWQIKRWCTPTPVGLLCAWEIPPEAAQGTEFAFLLHKPFDVEPFLSSVATAVHPQTVQTPTGVA